MCGLAGIVHPERGATWNASHAVGAMMESLSHRGPDDEGQWCDTEAGVFLGFRRLAILDLSSAGHQPMVSATGRFVITFNGEIYNFKELRGELADCGFTFRGGSDTEVMLAAFERWGVPSATERLRGMFAFAVWDTRDRRLWLARDRMGIKPLYLLREGNGLAFASEARAIRGCPLFRGRGDASAALQFLERLYVPTPKCILEGVEKVRPGEVLEFRVEGGDVREVSRSRYWTLGDVAATAQTDLCLDEEEALAGLLDLVREAVRLRMVADVPVGAFLSGGIDSTLVVAVMQELASEPIRTFTIRFDDPDFDEGRFAEEVAGHLGTRHTSVGFATREVLDMVPSLPGLSDEPMANPSLLPTFLVSRVARNDVIVALSGDGGDELFGGYNRYVHGAKLIRRAERVPSPLRDFAGGVLEWMAGRTPSRFRFRSQSFGSQYSLGERLLKLSRLLRARDSSEAYDALLRVGSSDPSLASPYHDRPAESSPLPLGEAPLESRMMLFDQLHYLPDDLLAKVDRASMFASLEARVPLLDHHVVAFSWRLPVRIKMRGGVTKWPLRQLAQRYVPGALLDRPKMGFTVPIDRWLREDLREWARDTLSPSSATHLDLWSPGALEGAWRAFDGGRRDLALPLWTATVLQAWSDHWKVGFN